MIGKHTLFLILQRLNKLLFVSGPMEWRPQSDEESEEKITNLI